MVQVKVGSSFLSIFLVVGNKLAKKFKKILPVTQVIEKLLGLGFTPTHP